MPIFIEMLGDTDETVSRPVMYQVVRDMMAETGLPLEQNILFPGTEGKQYQPGSTITAEPNVPQTRMMFGNQVTVDVDEQYDKDRLLTTAVYGPENLYIFKDEQLETDMRPTYSSSEVSINLRFRANSKVSAIKWRDEMRQRFSMGRDVRLHEMTYYYFIPPELLVILKEIHRLRENVQGYGDTWDEYLQKYGTTKLSIQTDQAGKNKYWAVSQTQMRVPAWFDWEGAPEQGSREDGGDTWTIGFSYKFRYDRPIGIVMSYPLVIHNQLLDQKWRPGPEDAPYEVEHQLREYTWSARSFALFETSVPMNKLMLREGLQVPDFDEFVPRHVLPNTLRVITLLVNIDPLNPKFLLNMTQLGDYNFDADVVEFFKSEAKWLATPYASVCNVALYQGREQLDPNLVTVDANLNVSTTIELSLRQYYHVRISLVTDMTMIIGKGAERMKKYCSAALKIFDTIDPTLKYRHLLPVCLPGNWLPSAGLTTTIDQINSGDIAKGNNQGYGPMHTVETLSIESYRKKS